MANNALLHDLIGIVCEPNRDIAYRPADLDETDGVDIVRRRRFERLADSQRVAVYDDPRVFFAEWTKRHPDGGLGQTVDWKHDASLQAARGQSIKEFLA